MVQTQSKVNPGFGHLRLIDYLVIFYCIVRIIGETRTETWELSPSCVYASAHCKTYSMGTSRLHPDLSLRLCSYDIGLLCRQPPVLPYPSVWISTHCSTKWLNSSRTNELLNPASIRFITRPVSEHLTSILSSPRYSPYRENINRLVARPDFTGYWVLQHSLKSPKAPSNSDVTIFYLHGGGYFSSLPAHYLLFLLRLAESILDQGVSVSIFTLDYSLAPEHVFPTQLTEAAAAYAYLVSEEQIPPKKMILMGDSAGGHLALSLLVSLHEDKAFEKPCGLVLMSPWLSLHHEPTSFTSNAHTDVLSAPFLRRNARRFLGHDQKTSRDAFEDVYRNSPYLEFLTPEPRIDWDVVLPSWVWVSAGEKEMFFDSVQSWAGMLKGRLGEQRVVFEVGFGKVHVWQWLETMMNGPIKKAFLATDVGDGRGFEATASVGSAIARKVKESQAIIGLQ